MQVIDRLPRHTSPKISARTFRSGRKVVHTPWFTQREFSNRLLILIRASGPKTTVAIANQENVSIGLVQEMIGDAERDGKVVRDETDAGEIFWWTNEFSNYVWDGD